MASDWIKTTLDDVCFKITDGAHKSPKSVDSGKPMASVKDLEFYGLNLETARHISEEDYNDLVKQGCKPELGDVLIAKDGNSALDTVCTFEKDAEVVLLSSVAILRPNLEKINSRFLKYYFLSSRTIEYLKRNFISGAAIPRVVLRDFKKAEISLPLLPEQKAIAHILGSLDDKIELNRQMNETLEAMAQALFKSWFVDFDPVIDNALAAGNAIPDEFFERAEQRKGIEKKDNSDIQDLFPDEFEFTEDMGWIPKGWKLINFGEFCDIKKGKNITKSTVAEGSVPVVAGGLNPAYYHNKSNVEGPVITVSASGANAGFINLYYQDIWASDCSYINESMSPFIFTTYSFLKYYQDKVFGLQHGAVQPHVYPKDLSRLNFIDSNEGVKIAIEKNLVSYYKKVKFNEELIETLTKLRDTLLPKLMSGEVRIPDAEALVENV